jgi:hypothetical protein
MRVLYALLAVLVFAPALNGCASIIRGGRQKVAVTSDPPGAQVFEDGVLLGTTPTELRLKREDDHRLVFRLEGYDDVTVELEREFDFGPTVVGNLFSWGLLGVVVDISSGAAYQLEPGEVEALMGGASGARLAAPQDGEDLRVVFFTREQAEAVLGPEALQDAKAR